MGEATYRCPACRRLMVIDPAPLPPMPICLYCDSARVEPVGHPCPDCGSPTYCEHDEEDRVAEAEWEQMQIERTGR